MHVAECRTSPRRNCPGIAPRQRIIAVAIAFVMLFLGWSAVAEVAPSHKSRDVLVGSEQRPADACGNARNPDPATGVELVENMSLDPSWSWALVAWILPAGPMSYLAFWLLAAVKNERQRRAVTAPSREYTLVNGRIRPGKRGTLPAIRVNFELEARLVKGGALLRERTHEIHVRPFTLQTTEGESIAIRPDRRTTELNAPVQGDLCTRWCEVLPGDRVWIYGRHTQEATGVNVGHARSKQRERSIDGHEARLLVSTEPMDGIFRQNRNHCVAIAMTLLALLLTLEVTAFGDYWKVVQAGQPTVGRIIQKSERPRTRTERFGRSSSSWVHDVIVEAGGRTERFEIGSTSFRAVCEGSAVPVVVTPTAMMLGYRPYTTVGTCVLAGILTLVGLAASFLWGRLQRPWYSISRGWRATDRQPRASVTKVRHTAT